MESMHEPLSNATRGVRAVDLAGVPMPGPTPDPAPDPVPFRDPDPDPEPEPMPDPGEPPLL